MSKVGQSLGAAFIVGEKSNNNRIEHECIFYPLYTNESFVLIDAITRDNPFLIHVSRGVR